MAFPSEAISSVPRFKPDQGISIWPNLTDPQNVINLLKGVEVDQVGMSDGQLRSLPREGQEIALELDYHPTRIHLYLFARNFILNSEPDLDAQLHFIQKVGRLTNRRRIIAAASR